MTYRYPKLASALTFAIALAALVFAAGETPDDPYKILSFGNSLTYYNMGQPWQVQQIGAAADPERYVYPGELDRTNSWSGVPLYHFIKPLQIEGTTARINETDWDAVVLQPFMHPEEKPDTFYHSVRVLDSLIDKAGAQTYLYFIWLQAYYYDRSLYTFEEKEAELAKRLACYEKIAKEVDAIIIPAALAWDAAIDERPDDFLVKYTENDTITARYQLHNPGGCACHAVRHGVYLTACTWYATLLGQDPQTTTFVYEQVRPEIAPYLRKVAWETVQAYTNGAVAAQGGMPRTAEPSIRYTVSTTPGRLHIRVSLSPASLTLLTLAGQQVARASFFGHTTLDTRGYAPSTYVLRLDDGRANHQQRITIGR